MTPAHQEIVDAIADLEAAQVAEKAAALAVTKLSGTYALTEEPTRAALRRAAQRAGVVTSAAREHVERAMRGAGYWTGERPGQGRR